MVGIEGVLLLPVWLYCWTHKKGIPEGDSKGAKMFKSLKYMDVLRKELEIMDSTAISLCKENKIPICVFNLFVKNNIKKIIQGQKIGTIVN